MVHIVVGRKQRKGHRKRPRQDGALRTHTQVSVSSNLIPPLLLTTVHYAIMLQLQEVVDCGLGEISQDPLTSAKPIRCLLRPTTKETKPRRHFVFKP